MLVYTCSVLALWDTCRSKVIYKIFFMHVVPSSPHYMSFLAMWVHFCACTCALSHVYLMSTLDVMHMTKYTILYAERTWRQSYIWLLCTHTLHVFVVYQSSSTCTRKPHTLTPSPLTTLPSPYILILTSPHTLTPSHPHNLTLTPTPSHPHPHSGGTNYTITGTGLNSVQQPRLLLYMEGAVREGRRRRQTASQNMNYIQSEVSMEHGSCKPNLYFLLNTVML